MTQSDYRLRITFTQHLNKYKMRNIELSEKVKELRVKKGMSQELLAEESGLSLRTIQRLDLHKYLSLQDYS